MGYAELIETLKSLPQEKQAEVFDFVDFLAAREACHRPTVESGAAGCRPLSTYLAAPWRVQGFTPLTRDEANARRP